MDYNVADAIASMKRGGTMGSAGDISAALPFGIAPGAKIVMRREKMAAHEVRYLVSKIKPGYSSSSSRQ